MVDRGGGSGTLALMRAAFAALRSVATLVVLALALVSAGVGAANATVVGTVNITAFAEGGAVQVIVSPVSGSGTPTGNVTIVGDSPIGTRSANLTGGQVRFNMTLFPGTYNVQITYAGDNNFASSTVTTSVTSGFSVSSSMVSSSSPLLTPIVSAPDIVRAVAGSTTDITVSVSGSGATPTGTLSIALVGVDVDENSTDLDGTGKGTISVAFPKGSYIAIVTYSGDANYAAGTVQVPINFSAAKASMSVSLSKDVPAPYEDFSIFTSLTGNSVPPTGQVGLTLTRGGETVDAKSAGVGDNGGVTFDETFLMRGHYTATLSYSGDSNYAAASTTYDFDIDYPTVVSSYSEPSSSSSSSSRPSSSSSSSSAQACATPLDITGTVDATGFTISTGRQEYGVVELTSVDDAFTGTRTAKTSDGVTYRVLIADFPVHDSYTVDVTYHGYCNDHDYPYVVRLVLRPDGASTSQPSISSSSQEDSGPAPQGQFVATQIAVDADPKHSLAGQTVTFTAQITADRGTPDTGDVVFKIDGVGKVVVGVHKGVASYATNTLGVGSHEITATYTGDDDVYGPSTPASVTVNVDAKAQTPEIVTNTATLWTNALLDVFTKPIPLPGSQPVTADGVLPDVTAFAPLLSPEGGHIAASLSAINAAAGNQKAAPFDAWIDGTFGLLAKGSTTGSYANGRAGASYSFNPKLLAGMLVSVDRIDSTDGSARMTGVGWLLGPYLSAKIGDSLQLTVGASGGLTQNDISPDGTYTDKVGGSHYVLNGTLSGQWQIDDWTFSPAVNAIYSQEDIDAYTDGLGHAMAAVTAGTGKIGVAPAVSHAFRLENGTLMVVGARFETAFKVEYDGGTWTYAGLQDEVGADASLALPGGATLSASGTVGGLLFGDVHSVRGTIGLNAALP